MKPTSIDLRKEELRQAIMAIAAKHDGYASSEAIVEAAREPSSPLHDEFVWDDSAAADAYRLAQAGALVRRLKLTIFRQDAEARNVKITTTRAFQSRRSQRHKDGGYETIESIMSDADKRAELLQQVKKELAAYRRRYAALTELAEVWYAVDMAIDEPSNATTGAELRPTA